MCVYKSFMEVLLKKERQSQLKVNAFLVEEFRESWKAKLSIWTALVDNVGELI